MGRGRYLGSGGREDHRITGVGRGRSWGAEEEGIIGSREWVEVGPGSSGRGDHRITGVGRGIVHGDRRKRRGSSDHGSGSRYYAWGAEEEGIIGSREWVEIGAWGAEEGGSSDHGSGSI